MAAQIILLMIIGLSLGIELAKHGQTQGRHNFWTTLISNVLMILLLLWGGFFDVFMK